MKKLFFFALMASMALCNVSCGSDDDDNDNDNKVTTNDKGNTTVGVFDEKAAHYEIANNVAPQTTATVKKEDGSLVEAKAGLTGFNVTEYGQAVIEVNVDGSKKYCAYDAKLKSGSDQEELYELYEKSKTVGTVTVKKKSAARATRGTETVELIFNLTVSVEINGEMVPLTFEDNAEAKQVVEETVKTVTTQLTNTWKVEYMKLVISYDDKSKNAYSTDEESGNLRPFIQKAVDNGVTLSDKDKSRLNRAIQSIIIDKNNLLVLVYDNGGSDAATWRWVNETGDLAIGITLKDSQMGNKFLSNNSKIGVELRDNGKANLILTTRLEEDKCTVSLIVNLK